MAAMLGYGREAVRVKVKKCEGQLQPEDRKFSVDPQITSFEVLLSILAKAFDIKGEFTVSYRVVDDYGQETYLSLLSDWDLDAAFLSASEPCLCLRVDMKKFEEGLALDDWEMTAPVSHEIHHHHHHHLPRMQVVTETKPQNRLPGLILNQVERTFSMVQRALNLVEDPSQSISSAPSPMYSTPCCSQSSLPPRPPLTDAEFRTFLGPLGQLNRGRELRAVVHLGGMEPSLRKVVWKHILNVYPEGMTGKERMDYMKKKSYEYEELRDTWKDMIKKGQMTEELAYVTSMVRKDVLRTDRHHKYYAGSDDNQNIASLFNVLTTYALNHPGVSYCQGMSDLASPLLVTMGDEAHAYITFVALMRRLRPNFTLDGLAMGAKFRHLGDGLAHIDPEFHAYLKSVQADDLLFCYRWLLLEMKREFAFEDALRMLEVLWSSLPLNPPPASGLQLYEDVPYSVRAKSSLDPCSNISAPCMDHPAKEIETKIQEEIRTDGEGTSGPSVKGKEKEKSPPTALPSTSPMGMRLPLRETPYTRLCALRRRTSSGKGLADRQNQSLDDNIWGRRRLQRAEEQARMARPFFSLDESLTPVEADEMKERSEQEERGDKVENRVRPAPIQRQHQVVKNLNEFLNLARGRKEKQKETKEAPKKEEVKKEPRHSGDGAEEGNKFNGDKTSPDTDSPTVEESSTEDDSAEYFPMTTSVTRELRLELESLDRQVFGETKVRVPSLDMDDEDEDEEEVENNQEEVTEAPRSPKNNTVAENIIVTSKCQDASKRGEGDGEDCFTDISSCKSQLQRAERIERYDRVVGRGGSGEEIFVWENPLQCPPTPDEQADLESDGGGGSPGSDDSESGNQGSYNGEVIEVVEAGGGTPGGGGVVVHVKSVTPIKLLRDLGNGPRARRTSSDSSDSSDAEVLPEDVISEKPRTSVEVGSGGGDGFLTTNSCEEVTEMTGLLVLGDSERTPSRSGESSESRGSGVMELPPPQEFGGGNPFLMFLCLTLLRQQRDHVMRAGMDANELAMHFDKMVRRHDVARVLNCARHMFAAYLRHHSPVAASISPSDSNNGVRSGGEGCSPTSNYAEGGSELLA